jgi:chemotaxis signal transduction protein
MSHATRQALDELRRSFDRSFAERPSSVDPTRVDLLDVRVGGIAYALRTSEVAGLVAGREITPLPSHVAELLGLIHVRGSLLPAYDLAAVLGHGAAKRPRWLALVAGSAVALAFDGFEGHTRVDARHVAPQRQPQAQERFVDDVVQLADRAQPVLSVRAVVESIRRAAAIRRSESE